MSLQHAQSRARLVWPAMAGVALLLLGGGAIVYVRWPDAIQDTRVANVAVPPLVEARPEQAPAAPTLTAPAQAEHPPSAPAVTEVIAPSFDIVRVTPQGGAVIAGRAEPFSQVTVYDGKQVLGEALADQRGQFVIVPQGRIAPGGRELTLTSRQPGGQDVPGLDSVVVVVGPPPAPPSLVQEAVTETKPEPPVAVLLPHDDAAPRMLQAPSKPQGLALNSVDYDQQGDIRFAGSARPSAPVRVYVDNKPVGETSTDPAGQWTLTPPASLLPGLHQLRVDELARGGEVQHRVEVPFQRTVTPLAGLSPGQMVVQPGTNLWRIARQSYGVGARYTVIYLANREHIRDPNRIYPGQIFAVPEEH